MIIGLIGRAGAGKDYTFVRMVKMGLPVQRRAFADQLRGEIEAILGVDTDIWKKPYRDEVRRLLQWWGTDLRRAADPGYWLNQMLGGLRALESNGVIPVVTDARFINEADVIQSLGGIIVRVWAPDDVRKERLGGILPPAHASEDELELIAADYDIESMPGVEFPADLLKRIQAA